MDQPIEKPIEEMEALEIMEAMKLRDIETSINTMMLPNDGRRRWCFCGWATAVSGKNRVHGHAYRDTAKEALLQAIKELYEELAAQPTTAA